LVQWQWIKEIVEMSRTVVIVAEGGAYQVTIENGKGSVEALDSGKTAAALKDAAEAGGALCARLEQNSAALGIMATLVNLPQ
jgi:hypothetical protein